MLIGLDQYAPISGTLPRLSGYFPTAMALAPVQRSRCIQGGSSGNLKIYAGNGTASTSGDGGAATAAGLFMRGLAVDAAGNVFIADPQNMTVRRVDSVTGIITTVAGGGTSVPVDGGLATAAALLTPNAVAIDKNGNLFVAELGRIAYDGSMPSLALFPRSLAQAQPVSLVMADRKCRSITQPSNVVFDSAGNLLIADTNNQRVRRIDSSTA
jgi:trimeric autotransporter adhesin